MHQTHFCKKGVTIFPWNDVGAKSPRLWCLRIVPCYALPRLRSASVRARHVPLAHSTLPNIRISWDYHPTFMLISGRVPRSFTHLWASSYGLRPFDPGIIKYDNNPVVTTAGKNKQAVSRRRYHSVLRDTLRKYFSRLCTATLCDRSASY